MTESAGLTLIETIVKLIDGFGDDNVKIAKWGFLNSGNSRFYAIIKPGPATRPRSAFGIRDNNYQTIVEVWYRFKDDGTTVTELLDKVNLIANKLDQYPVLGDTTDTIRRSAEPAALGEMTEQWKENGDGPSWLMRPILVDWTQESEVSYAE